MTPAPGIVFTERLPAGIRFTERMSGWWSPDPLGRVPAYRIPREAYEAAYAAGEEAGRGLDLVVTVVADDVDAMVRHPHHEAPFAGTATLGADAPDGTPALVTDGLFRLFVERGEEVASRAMEYDATFTLPGGSTLEFEGFKAIRHGGGVAGFQGEPERGTRFSWLMKPQIWIDQTRLFFRLHGGQDAAIGILTVSGHDFLRQLWTMRSIRAADRIEAFDTVARFLVFYGGVLRDTYGGPLARSRYAPPNWWERKRRTLRGLNGQALESEPVAVRAADGVGLCLTRWKPVGPHGSGHGQPIVLAPGFGVRADSFAIDTVGTNLVEHLARGGYDVWLFDYRASPELKASRQAFSLDHVAELDWPAAIKVVLQATGKDRVDVVAHCVAALTFMMSALTGALEHPKREGSMIRRAVCSQVSTHVAVTNLVELKTLARLGTWLEFFGQPALRVTVHAKDTYRRPLADRLLKLYPTEDPCDNPVCRRIRFVFGESYLHKNLNRETHDAIIEMFGDPRNRLPAYASLRALRHLSRIVTARHIVGEDGDDRYLDAANVRHLDFRLGLLGGLRNAIFTPEGVATSHDWLAAAGAEVEPLFIREYGHMDCFIGDAAADHVFPKIESFLTRP
jgi:cholesterol oxidase